MRPVRVLLLIAIACAAYANSLNGPLLLDDEVTIVENPQIRELWRRDVLMPERELPVAGRPLANVTFAINYAIGGTGVRGYHVANLLLHVLCGLVVFVVMQQILRLPALRPRFGEGTADIPCAVALLWLVHPLNSEVVNYLTQRTESLMAIFYLLTIAASLRALEAPGRWWPVIAVVACALGALCKESIVTAPVAVMLLDRLLVFDSWRSAWRARRGLYLGLFATWVLLAAILLTGPRIRSAGFGTDVGTWNYLLNQAVMITRYLWLTIWPRSLVVYYGWPQPQTLGGVFPYVALVLALVAGVVIALKYRPTLALAGLWFFLTLTPTSSVLPIATEVGAERRMYLPLLALVVLAVVALWSATKRPQVRLAVVAILTVLLGTATFARNREYADTLRLAEVTLARWPTGISHQWLGEQLLIAGRRDEAMPHLREAIKDAPRAHYTLGMQLYKEGTLDEAISELQAFVRLQPLLLEVPAAQVTLARAYARQQRWAQAETEAQDAIRKAPRSVEARAVYAEVLFKQEKAPEAIAAYTAYLAMRPSDVSAMTNLAILLISSGRVDEALTVFRRAADTEPSNGDARRNLATALLDANRLDDAALEARRAIALRPRDPVTYDLLGQALARQGRLDEALAQFDRAVQVDPSYAEAQQHRNQARTLLRR